MEVVPLEEEVLLEEEEVLSEEDLGEDSTEKLVRKMQIHVHVINMIVSMACPYNLYFSSCELLERRNC